MMIEFIYNLLFNKLAYLPVNIKWANYPRTNTYELKSKYPFSLNSGGIGKFCLFSEITSAV